MQYYLDNVHLDIEPIDDDILVVFKEERIVSEEDLEQIEADILKLAECSPCKLIILDFKKVKSMSSAFLGFLVKLQSTVTQGRGHLKLRNINPEILKVFKITMLHKVFTIENV